MSVIISTTDVAAAVQAIENSGGYVTSNLWLIDSLAAVVPADQLTAVSRAPGITAVTENQVVLTADDNDYGRDRSSWVSNRRRTMGEEELASRPKTPALALPDGGAFLIAEHGEVTILNANGSLRAQLDLPGGYKLAPFVASDGTIVVTSEDKYLHAVGPDGALLWTHINGKNFKVSAVLDEDNPLFPEGVIYAINEDGVVSALNKATGQVYWSLACKNLVPEDPGKVKGRPVVGQDGRLFVVSEKGYLFALMPQVETAVLDWVYRASGDHFEYAVMIGTNEIVYLPHEDGVTAVTPSGAPAFNLVTEKHVTAQPILMDDSTLLVPAEKYLYAVNSDGQVRFRFLSPFGGKFEASPVVSPDQGQIYAPLKEKHLFALNAVNGELLWSHNSSGDLKASPVVESNGDIHLGAADGRYTILSPAGQILFQKQLPGDLRVSPTLSASEESIFLPAESMTVEALALLPDSWDGVPDVRATDDPRVWEFASPVTIDVGADVLHDGQLNGKASLSGAGVTVAVVDSGVYFDRDVKAVLGSEVEQLFMGQADFTNYGQCPYTNGDVVQYSGYCWTNHKASVDPYGHGSHVAGIIWNHFQDADTQVNLGIAPGAKIISIRVLNQEGVGTYEEVINGIQFAVAHKDEYNIRVMNLSLSGLVTSPYFADPLNQAVEAAWAEGIVVLAAAGNTGSAAQSITVPGNDPYIITVGAVDSKRTAGFWGDDLLPSWASAGPTFDGFIKPDIVAPGSNVVSFMYNSPDDFAQSAYLVRQHPDYAETMSLFRMNGTSMATAVTSGVVALMLEAHPNLTPDQVKFRLMAGARSAMTDDQEPVFSVLQQGAGRLWAPEAVYGDLPLLSANDHLDLQAEQAHRWQVGDNPDPTLNPDLAYHFQGPVRRLISDDGQAYIYYIQEEQGGPPLALGIAWVDSLGWIDQETAVALNLTFGNNEQPWTNGAIWAGGTYAWSGGTYAWSGGTYAWSGGTYAWSGGTYAWSGGTYAWSGGNQPGNTQVSATAWIDD